MSRKSFIEANGATCRNWTWSWSFVNDAERFVVFGAWDRYAEEDRVMILDRAWERSGKGKRNPGYIQSLEHVRLIEEEGYELRIFPMLFSHDGDDSSPARIKGFEPVLSTKRLLKDGCAWFAV